MILRLQNRLIAWLIRGLPSEMRYDMTDAHFRATLAQLGRESQEAY